MQFSDIIQKYREDSNSKRDLGTRFEELIARYLMTDPAYSNQLEWVKLWMDFPGRMDLGKTDTGIDLVAKTLTGEYWAIQCKCYAEDTDISKSDMDTFIATSGRNFEDEEGNIRGFSFRMVVATTEKWSENALEVLHGQTIPAAILGLNILSNAQVDWEEIEKGAHGVSARSTKHALRPHQQDALNAAIEHYKTNSRGRMIMACGTGKTFTSLKIAEEMIDEDSSKNPDKPACILFLAPSIALVGQTLREWSSNTNIEHMNAICVCSDASVSKKVSLDDVGGDRIEYLGLPATTDAGRIAFQYNSSNNTTVIFSTYQSIESIIRAQQVGLPEFNLVICDEAHRTTGAMAKEEKESNFTKVHSDDNIRTARRLYMTATPRLYGEAGKRKAEQKSIVLCSMDDETLYGKEFYHISFGQAVEKELLSDYKVLILTTSEDEIPDMVKRHWTSGGKEIDVDTNCKLWGCINALNKNIVYDETLKNTDPDPMRSAVSFCRSIKVSKAVTERFNELARLPDSPRRATMRHIDGSMSAMNRQSLTEWLKNGSDEECHILSNVRCLSEGVDVPALDAVMFLDSKSSIVDVVQSVGRVMRRAEGKKYGYIIIPIVVPKDETPEEALDDNERYKVVWDVLRALRSHDERLDAEINTIQLRKDNIGGHIHIGCLTPEFNEEMILDESLFRNAQYTLDEFGNALFARLVIKVGDREYIENWAKKVADIMPDLMNRLKKICTGDYYDDDSFNPIFKKYHSSLMMCVNEDVTEEDAVKMLAQQIVTKPIFEKLFREDGFAVDNSVSQTIDNMLNEINARNGLEDINHKLNDFYENIEMTMSRIDTAEGKQKVITALYEKFFKNAFPKDQTINGVVYTPIPIVDFIIRSAVALLKTEFGLDINDSCVKILDPFTGTGTFVARLIESGLISKNNLKQKYCNDIFANEITLLAYYIAAVNIENTYTRTMGSDTYVPFENILLTDTFNIEEICRKYGTSSQQRLTLEDFFYKNREIIRKENETSFKIIIGNPPYGATQKTGNDNAKKRKYKTGIDARIESTYLNPQLFTNKISNVNSIYDNYIRAFRWATDRIGDEDGIISFVTPNGWLIGSAFEGFRKQLENDFSKIFVFDLRGDMNSPDWKKEGGQSFGSGSKVGISITILVKNKKQKSKGTIYYYKVPDYSKREDKYHILETMQSVPEMMSHFDVINPADNGDWIIKRNSVFQTLIPLAGDSHKKFEKHYENTIFVGYSLGYATGRDAWSYNYSFNEESKNMNNMIQEYSEQLNEGTIQYYPDKIKWNRNLEESFAKKELIKFDESNIVIASYRPYCKQHMYNDKNMLAMTYQMAKFFPPNKENKIICISCVGEKKRFSCLITDTYADLHFVGSNQCFPLYWYEDSPSKIQNSKQTTLFSITDEMQKYDGISDYILENVKNKYSKPVTKEDIFYYVYGYLHSEDYRDLFEYDLKMSLPNIGLVESYDDFIAFSNAGRRLAELHLNYENVPPYPGLTINGKTDLNSIIANESIHKITKMKLKEDEHKLIYNDFITIGNIPDVTFDYIINGRSALANVVDQYQVRTDKASGIINDPNEYAGSTYVLKLVLSIINVSVQTMEIVRNLPKLTFEKENTEE